MCEQSRGEELANSMSHGLWRIAALAGTPFLILHAIRSFIWQLRCWMDFASGSQAPPSPSC